jgi:hypothetical protein
MVMIPGSLLLWCASVGTLRSTSPTDGNKSRIPYPDGSLPPQNNFKKFKPKNIIEMKNKPDPALLDLQIYPMK